jgi:hypothetical protein
MNNMSVCRLPMSLNKLIFMQWMPPDSVVLNLKNNSLTEIA